MDHVPKYEAGYLIHRGDSPPSPRVSCLLSLQLQNTFWVDICFLLKGRWHKIFKDRSASRGRACASKILLSNCIKHVMRGEHSESILLSQQRWGGGISLMPPCCKTFFPSPKEIWPWWSTSKNTIVGSNFQILSYNLEYLMLEYI